MKFDAKKAKELQPDEHILIANCNGLRLCASKSKRTWIYRYKSPIDGKMKQYKIGEWPGTSLAAAVARWETLSAERSTGRDPAEERRNTRKHQQEVVIIAREAKQATEYTVRRICDEYLAEHIADRRKPKGQKEVARLFDKMLGKTADIPAMQLTRAQAFDLINAYRKTPVVAANLRSELRAAWNHALDAGRLPEITPNWWEKVLKKGALKSKGRKINGINIGAIRRSLNEDELSLLIPWLPNFSPTVADALTLYLWTGTRGDEIVGMKVEEITEENGVLWWTVPKEKTKNARFDDAVDLRVPLLGRTVEIIRRRMAGKVNGYIFPATNKNSTKPHVQQKVVGVAVHQRQIDTKNCRNTELERTPIKHWAAHDLRRTVRTLLASMECPDEIGEAVLGHMPIGIKGTYNRHTYDPQRLHWLTKLDAKLEELAARNVNNTDQLAEEIPIALAA